VSQKHHLSILENKRNFIQEIAHFLLFATCGILSHIKDCWFM